MDTFIIPERLAPAATLNTVKAVLATAADDNSASDVEGIITWTNRQ